MKRYIKRGHVWLLIDGGYVVVLNLSSGIYVIEIFDAVHGSRALQAWAQTLKAAKTRGRVELHGLRHSSWT